MVRNAAPDLDAMAREYFGYEGLRPPQREAIEALLKGQDVLAIMPTGSGKSAIYQIAALRIPGTTVIVSPLIALQKDQLESIRDRDLPDAALINSCQRAAQRREALEKFDAGSLEFLFLAPEQLANAETAQRLQERKPSLFVVDEAHCMSEWGHDFRPDYARLGTMIGALGRPRILALTATAAPQVREEIVRRLGMKKPRVIVWGFDRPNIHLAVEACADEYVKERAIVQRVAEARKPGIVYVATQEHAEAVAALLAKNQIKAGYYHGGMKGDERHAAQDAFMADAFEVMVATNAFGMGVDKPNVRFVFHFDIPESVDAYYQEIGRAGRDGEPARALLLYRAEDVGLRRAMASGGKIGRGEVEKVMEAVAGADEPVTPGELAEQTELSRHKLARTLNRLEEAGAVELSATGEVAASAGEPAKVVEAVLEEQRLQREYRRARVEVMEDYAKTRLCRRHFILNYFGEENPAFCPNCDNCQGGISQKEQARETAKVEERGEEHPFAVKSRVRHKEFGAGLVMRYEEGNVVVLFDEGAVGSRSLNTKFVMEHRLLSPA